MASLARRTSIAQRVLCALAMAVVLAPVTPASAEAAPAPFQPSFRVTEGWPGDFVSASFFTPDYQVIGCRLFWAEAPDDKAACDGIFAGIQVPGTAAPGPSVLQWEMEYEGPGPELRTYGPSPFVPPVLRTSGEFEFLVKGVVAAADRTEAGTVEVSFRPVGTSVVLGGCGVDKPVKALCPAGPGSLRRVRFLMPPGSRFALHWYAESGPRGRGHADDGEIPIDVPPLPEIEFDVRGQADELGPGQPFVATFQSLTPGVTITGCGLTLGERSGCGASHVALVRIPPGAESGTTLTIPWDLSYTSKRPGEEPDTRKGELKVRVKAEPSEMRVTVQPASALPGDEVVLTFVSLRPRVAIRGCLVFFPNDPGANCQRSPRRWFARTRVPPDAVPGAALLRWGVESISVDEQIIVDSGAFAFTVRTRDNKRPSRTAEPSRTTDPSRSADPSRVLPPIKPLPDADPLPPEFIATSDPESAAPGRPVTVSVAAVTADVIITGCTAAFRGSGGVGCRATGGGAWSARLAVPRSAEPGDRPLDWRVFWRDSAGRAGRDAGTVSYRVASASAPATVPAFQVEVTPPKARPGGRVTVTHNALDAGVTITGCRAGFISGGDTAACHRTGQGWAADVTVPGNAPGGTGAVLWNVAYERSGPGSADGLTHLEVEPTLEAAGFWSRVTGFGGRVALGAAVLVGFIAYRGVASRLRDRFRQRRTPAAELPDTVRVVPAADAGTFVTELNTLGREPHPVIRLKPFGGPSDVRLAEEPP